MKQVAPPQKRCTFYEHIILRTEGCALMLMALFVLVLFPYLFLRDRLSALPLAWWDIPVLILAEAGIYFGLLRPFWYRCFGYLVVTEDEIRWKCPFMRAVRLKKTEIRYTGIDRRWPGTAGKTITSMDMAYFSTAPYPRDCVNKSYLLRNKTGFIKFPASEKLCSYMREWLPEPYERVFAAASEGYEAERRKRERRRAEKNKKAGK